MFALMQTYRGKRFAPLVNGLKNQKTRACRGALLRAPSEPTPSPRAKSAAVNCGAIVVSRIHRSGSRAPPDLLLQVSIIAPGRSSLVDPREGWGRGAAAAQGGGGGVMQ